jgi:two-component system nitrogen regulation sensor histidine kinase NtrY
VLTDVERTVREEERVAWQRLIRVLGHEINNSLAPIQSLARSLQDLAARSPRPPDWDDDVLQALAVIQRRSEALGRFMSAYTQLARLPPPQLAPVDVGLLVERVVRLETRAPVAVERGPAVRVRLDADQVEQALINLVRNAVEASLETGGAVTVRWRIATELEVEVLDEGPGVVDGGNLFVPFFTTRPGGSGIGLTLSRQIAEAHGGRLALENRSDRRGAVARLVLPLG